MGVAVVSGVDEPPDGLAAWIAKSSTALGRGIGCIIGHGLFFPDHEMQFGRLGRVWLLRSRVQWILPSHVGTPNLDILFEPVLSAAAAGLGRISRQGSQRWHGRHDGTEATRASWLSEGFRQAVEIERRLSRRRIDPLEILIGEIAFFLRTVVQVLQERRRLDAATRLLQQVWQIGFKGIDFRQQQPSRSLSGRNLPVESMLVMPCMSCVSVACSGVRRAQLGQERERDPDAP